MFFELDAGGLLIPHVLHEPGVAEFLPAGEFALEGVVVAGREIPLARLCGATDSRHWKALGIPVPVLGVTGGNEHSAGEYVELDSIGRYADAIVKFADELAAE